jgi:hypothetical protein
MSCEAGGGTSAPAGDGLAALDDTALATLFEQLPGLGMSRELVVVVPAVSRRWRSVCRHLVSRSCIHVTRPLTYACALTAAQATAQPMLRIPSSLVPARLCRCKVRQRHYAQAQAQWWAWPAVCCLSCQGTDAGRMHIPKFDTWASS